MGPDSLKEFSGVSKDPKATWPLTPLAAPSLLTVSTQASLGRGRKQGPPPRKPEPPRPTEAIRASAP